MANETEQGRYRGQSSRSSNDDVNDAGGRRDDESGDSRRNRYRDHDDERMSQGDRYGAFDDYPQERRGDDWQRRRDQPRLHSHRGDRSESWGGARQGFGESQYREQDRRGRMEHDQSDARQSGDGQSQTARGKFDEWYGGQQPYANQQQNAGGGQGYGQSSAQGESGYSRYGQHGRAMATDDDINDPDYHEWRNGQMKAFDDDYRSWRGEKQKKFSEEFDNYRKNRDRSPASGDESKYGKSTTPKSS